MCYNLVKVLPRRYYSNVYMKNNVVTRDLYAGLLHNESKYVYYPCGKCYECREQKIESWQIRWKEHLNNMYDGSCYMLTITYNDQNIPTIETPKGLKTTLDYTDIQKFLKRIRKRQWKICKDKGVENPTISYHGCGEYGTQFTKRPHYHILIANCVIDPREFESIWGKGFVHYGDAVDHNTIKYILKYTLKNSLDGVKKTRVADENGNFLYNIVNEGQKNEFRVAEKSFCSKGIGKSFLTPEIIKYYEDNPDAHYMWQNYNKKGEAKLKPLPRYYKELLFNPNLIENGKIKRDDHGRPIKLYNPLKEGFENTPRFKKMLLAYKKEQQYVKNINDAILQHGYDNYLSIIKKQKYQKIQKYKIEIMKSNAKQNSKNAIQGALLI